MIVLSLFALLSVLILIATAYIFVKHSPTNVYRKHILLIASLLADSLSVTLANSCLLECLDTGKIWIAIPLAVLSLCLAAFSAGFTSRKLLASE